MGSRSPNMGEGPALRPGSLGIGVIAGSQRRYEHLCLPNSARLRVSRRNFLSGLVHELFSPMRHSAATLRPLADANRGKARSASCRRGSPHSRARRGAAPELRSTANTGAAPAPYHPGRPAKPDSVPLLTAAQVDLSRNQV